MNEVINDIDIAICGAGPVGQALALLLHQQGVPANRIALFDAKTSVQAQQDARSIALSYGSQQLLQKARCWPIKATRIGEIHVSRRGHFGRSLIKAEEYGVPALGYVARYGDIVTPMEIALQQAAIRIHRPVLVQEITEADDHVRLHLQHTESGQSSTVSANMLVQAEGGTFSDQSVRHQHHDYQQTAIIAHVLCDQRLAERAFERFTEQGPLALLPQEDGYALVWCVRPATAQQLMALDEPAFRLALQQAFGGRLGTFTATSSRVSYPLGLNAQPQATARIVSIGNAAQTLHPVAGQGLNLGLRDSFVLATCLSQNRDQPDRALQQFLTQRQTDRRLTIRLTDSMARLFASSPDGSLTQILLGLGLGTLDICSGAKKILAEQMMYGWRS
ncbi:FAD-dependent monooxygenase [Undibacterium sp. SXout7W]|uniref:FAD-dependent monooxygenase n=1 Tax=Undibacterium sp. SXout7W TaxID=3413049 RepID=UPI003BEFF011